MVTSPAGMNRSTAQSPPPRMAIAITMIANVASVLAATTRRESLARSAEPRMLHAPAQAAAAGHTAGPAAGITFQTVATGPFQIMNDPNTPNLIQVATTKPPTAAVGNWTLMSSGNAAEYPMNEPNVPM